MRRVGLLRAVAHALSSAQLRSSAPPPTSAATTTTTTTDLPTLLRQNRDRIVVVFPECATTNGKAILPLAPALAHAPPGTVVFPLSVRYAPTDVTTPVPGWAAAGGFLWTLLSQPAHGVRVRIAEGMTAHGMEAGRAGAEGEVTAAEQKVLDRIAEALARLGRSRRVGLTVGDKARFVEAWMKKGKK